MGRNHRRSVKEPLQLSRVLARSADLSPVFVLALLAEEVPRGWTGVYSAGLLPAGGW